MGDVIPFKRLQDAVEIADRKANVTVPKKDEFAERMIRVRASLEKIQNLMDDLKRINKERENQHET